MLGFDPASGAFERRRLAESTSMVNSPVDIGSPDLARFSRFREALRRRRECRVGAGDVLYLPAFWCVTPRGRRPAGRAPVTSAAAYLRARLPACLPAPYARATEFSRRWHEVRSSPSAEGLSLAVNRWFKPVMSKPFPCATCAMAFNEDEYADLLAFL